MKLQYRIIEKFTSTLELENESSLDKSYSLPITVMEFISFQTMAGGVCVPLYPDAFIETSYMLLMA